MCGQTKRCSKCEEVKSVSEFRKHSGKKDGLQCQCKTCRGVYDKTYQQSENFKQSQKKYIASEKGREKQSRYKKSSKGIYSRIVREGNETYKNIRRLKFKLNCESLSNGYIKSILRIKNPPGEIIELKRAQILLIREIKNATN